MAALLTSLAEYDSFRPEYADKALSYMCVHSQENFIHQATVLTESCFTNQFTISGADSLDACLLMNNMN